MSTFRLLALGLVVTSVSGAAWCADGQQIYSQGGANPAAMACGSCHGAQGEGMDAGGFPRLAGQAAAYVSKQLQDFRSGSRTNPVMQPIAQALAEEEIAALAPAIAAMPNPLPPLVGRDAVPTSPGERLALRGAWERNIPECVSCHGPSGAGVGASFPRLAGQGAQYLGNTLRAWRDGSRNNDPQQLMVKVAKAMTEEEITAVAEYFSSIGQAQEGAR